MSYCYANPNPIFQPAMRIIAAITQSDPAQVTTTFAHQYKSGTIVRLVIPPADGMIQADQFVGPILVTGETTFTVPLNTIKFDPFVIPVAPLPQTDTCALVIPVGEVNSQLNAATVNILPYGAT